MKTTGTPKKKSPFVSLCIAVAAFSALSASARTVYDAGKALRENCTSGGHANPYTDANGGQWSYHLANNEGVIKTTATLGSANGSRTFSSVTSGTIDGFSIGTAQAGSIRTIVSGEAIKTVGDPLEVDELFMFPENHEEKFPMVRFTAKEAGWYSAFVSAHDLANDATANQQSGVRVRMFAQGKAIVNQIVSSEGAANSTRRFDFQMTVRHLLAGETIDVVVDRNGGNANDPTGVKFFVTKEDEGAFYDSGIAMANCVSSETTYASVYGNKADGTWYYLYPEIDSGVDLVTWAPTSFTYAVSNNRFTFRCSRTEGIGFCNNGNNASPFAVVNTNATGTTVGALEVCAHPGATRWTTVRFRPPASGYYSGSVVVRDISSSSGSDGVRVYLNIADHVVTNAAINLDDHSSTAHFSFDARLLAAGEPIDVVVSPLAAHSADATAISAIFRREPGDVYDASTAFAAQWAGGSTVHPFADLLGGGATWDVGYKTNAWTYPRYITMPVAISADSTLGWCIYASSRQGQTPEKGNLPRIALATNGVASTDASYYVTADRFYGTVPNEMWVHPNGPNLQSSSPTVRAKVPESGIYTVRGHARDLSPEDGGDGIRFSIAANGYIAASALVSRDGTRYAGSAAEASVEGKRLWLKPDTALDAVIDPVGSNAADGTGLGVCYVKESTAIPRVINIDITGSDENYVGAGREGWSDWNKWNGIRFSSKLPATAERTKTDCREADGTTRRNVSFTLKRDSNANIDKGWSPTGFAGPTLLRIWAKSTGPGDTYTFTISRLKANEPYTLYLYSAKGIDTSGNAVDGNARFTVGGVTKSADETWNLRDGKALARFDVTSDANGEITGTFAAGDADTSSLVASLQGGAFNGLTLVGEFPDYVPQGAAIILR